MAVETWLIDKSAYVRLGESPDRDMWAERMSRGVVLMSSITMMEIVYSFRSASQGKAELDEPPLRALPVEYLGIKAEVRAAEIQRALLDASQHRGVSIPDLLIAASAEVAGHTVLHVDSDFDIIARYSGQRTERLLT